MPGTWKRSLGGQKNGEPGDHRQRGKSDIFVTFLATAVFLDAAARQVRERGVGGWRVELTAFHFVTKLPMNGTYIVDFPLVSPENATQYYFPNSPF
jgi:hypothetical protein